MKSQERSHCDTNGRGWRGWAAFACFGAWAILVFCSCGDGSKNGRSVLLSPGDRLAPKFDARGLTSYDLEAGGWEPLTVSELGQREKFLKSKYGVDLPTGAGSFYSGTKGAQNVDNPYTRIIFRISPADIPSFAGQLERLADEMSGSGKVWGDYKVNKVFSDTKMTVLWPAGAPVVTFWFSRKSDGTRYDDHASWMFDPVNGYVEVHYVDFGPDRGQAYD